MRAWIEQPLVNVAAINARLDGVEELVGDSVARADIAAALSKIFDIERLMTRTVYGSASPREIYALAAPVLKHIEKISEDVSLGDQKNMVFSGAVVVYGRGSFVVTGTGMNTEMGKIAGLLESAENKLTPLQQKIEDFSKKLGVGIVILALLIFIIQVARNYFMAGNGEMTQIILDS